MRVLELALILSLGLVLIRNLIPRFRQRFPAYWIELALATFAGLQLILEGYRWQLLPAYFLVGLQIFLGWRTFRGQQSPHLPGWSRPFLSILILGIYLISVLLPALLPIPRLSTPTGVYGIGTRTWHWVDEHRMDPYAPEEMQPREIVVQAWYPIDPSESCETSPWMTASEIVAPAVAGWLDLPSFFLDHLVHVETLSCKDAPIATHTSSFPVLLFSHGFGGFRAQNTNQMQHLASYGFVVIAIEHTYASVVTVFPDGRIALHNPDTLPDGLSPAEDLAATRLLGDQWAGDLSFVLDRLTARAPGDIDQRWIEALDLERIGAFGHSTGGGAVIEFCQRDRRCAATLTLDPFVKPVSELSLKKGLGHFALHMFSETWSSAENLDRFREIAESSASPPLVVSVLGSGHYDFSDLPLLTALAHALGLKGPINGARMAEIANDYLLGYFKQMLTGGNPDLLAAGLEKYPEVEILFLDIRP